MSGEEITVGGFAFLATLFVGLPLALLGYGLSWVAVEGALVVLLPLVLVWVWSRWVRDEEPAERAGDVATEEGRDMSDEAGTPGAGAAQGQAGAEAATPVAVVVEPVVVSQTGLTDAQLGTLRETLVKANPQAVPELIQGGTFEELTASVARANAAGAEYARRLNVQTAAVVVGGGGSAPDAATVASLSGPAKIAYALTQKSSK